MKALLNDFLESDWTLFAALFTFGLIAYANVLNGQFLYDDISLVASNEHIRSFGYIKEWFTSSPTDGAQQLMGNPHYRPLQTFVNATIYAFFGLKQMPFHLVSFLIHVINSLLVFKLLKKIKLSQIAAFIGSLLFLLHPVQTESVSYIAGLPEPLGAFFLFLGLLFYIKPGLKNLAIALLLFVGALLSKEGMIVFAPLAVLLSLYFWRDYKPVQKKHVYSSIIAVSLLAAFYLILNFKFLHLGLEGEIADDIYHNSVFVRLINFVRVLWDYLILIICPIGLYFYKSTFVVDTPFTAQGLAGLAILIGGLIAAGYSFFKEKKIFLAVGWFLLAMLPYMGIIPTNAIYYEHWLYVSIIGWIIPVAVFYDYFKQEKHQKIFLGVVLIILVLFTGRIILRNTEWSDSIKFYSNEIEYSPENPDWYYGIGRAYHLQGELENATQYYQNAITLDENHFLSYYTLALIYEANGAPAEAEAAYLKIIELSPEFLPAYQALNNLYTGQGRLEEADNYDLSKKY